MARRLHGRGLDIFEGTGSHGRYRRGPGPLTLAISVTVVLALVGATVWLIVGRMSSDSGVPLVVFGIEGPDGQLLRLADAEVTGPDGKKARTDAEGNTHLPFTAPAELAVSAAGYHDALFQVQAIPPDGSLGLQLDPLILRGRVKDQHGTGIMGAAVRVGGQEINTDEMGSFEVVAVAPGAVQVSKFAWGEAEAEWDGSPARFEVTLEPFLVKGIRIHGPTAGIEGRFDEILEMIEGTAINALVFDTKDEKGRVSYETAVAGAQGTGAMVYDFDVEALLAKAKERGYYTITRIVTFQDAFWATANPEHAARNTATGGVWTTYTGQAWADPTDREAWEYPLELALEACRLGFDEIQFDYVRFPSDGDVSVLAVDESVDQEGRVETVVAFLEEARERLHAEGCVVSADVFAIVLSVGDDQGIGQRVEEVSGAVDALSPMIYPSHYSSGWLGFPDPNAHPAEVVGQALEAGLPRMRGAFLRPWLQAFFYNRDQIAAEIQQAEDRGLGWMLWNQTSSFEADWFPQD
ncbi:MAG: hypothetical protein JW785_02120 [Acidimicrobiia bacterium]|nr:hypothetical protein [Acidimicrobiia bacterium]